MWELQTMESLPADYYLHNSNNYNQNTERLDAATFDTTNSIDATQVVVLEKEANDEELNNNLKQNKKKEKEKEKGIMKTSVLDSLWWKEPLEFYDTQHTHHLISQHYTSFQKIKRNSLLLEKQQNQQHQQKEEKNNKEQEEEEEKNNKEEKIHEEKKIELIVCHSPHTQLISFDELKINTHPDNRNTDKRDDQSLLLELESDLVQHQGDMVSTKVLNYELAQER